MLGSSLASVSVPAASAADGLRWQIEASVPVICAILSVEAPGDQNAGIAVATNCNAERYQLNVSGGTGAGSLRAARSTAGPVQISGSTVTISSLRPGYALTTIELAQPVGAGQVAVTLQPL
ncbi:hypothetical protein ACLBKU_15830 [Erythrobacter sp. NE805]|uniref:hypothetical protein n=1 Tax=Erythrobacter sp. NE805 TaxID=3389875 RepID=UPI00396AF8CF